MYLSFLLLILVRLGRAGPTCNAPWEFVGPQSVTSEPSGLRWAKDIDGGDDDDDDDDQNKKDVPFLSYCGAIHRVAGSPNGPWFVATANGGVWRTKNLSVAYPHWEPVTDDQPVTCSAMASLAIHPDNPRLVVAGCGGSTSGEQGETWNTLITGDWSGVMLTKDGGASWAMTTFPPNYNVNGITFTGPTSMLVAARSHFFNPNDGGIFISNDLGQTWRRTLDVPSVDVVWDPATKTAWAAASTNVRTAWTSTDGGNTWKDISNGLNYGIYVPYYSQMEYGPLANVLFMGTYGVNPNDTTDTESFVNYYDIKKNVWTPVPNPPDRMDEDRMPKDKISVLPDPTDSTLLYVVANADAFAWRVKWQTGVWEFMAMNDTSEGTFPHVDCRDLVWDYFSNSLLLTTDGGIFRRTQPGKAGAGTWRSLSGDIGIMEYLAANWDARLGRFVAGAQDNSVQITPPRKSGDLGAMGVVGGDGTRTVIDNVNCPARMYGSAQFLDGLGVFYGDPLKGYPINLIQFQSAYDFPFFVQSIALNSQTPDQFLMWANRSDSRPSSLYEFAVPGPGVPPAVHPVGLMDGIVLDLIYGGFTKGVSDPSFIAAVNNTHLFVSRQGQMDKFRLPTPFAAPIQFPGLDSTGQWILGPISHGPTMFMSASPADSDKIVVTGWPVDWNNGNEHIFFTQNGGVTFENILGNLPQATQATGRVRPQGVSIVEFTSLGFDAILVGTVNGVYVTFTDQLLAEWTRIGARGDFPIVITAGLSYEPYSDTLVAATYGRGVWILENAKTAILKVHNQQIAGTCDVPTPSAPSSLPFFPPQKPC